MSGALSVRAGLVNGARARGGAPLRIRRTRSRAAAGAALAAAVIAAYVAGAYLSVPVVREPIVVDGDASDWEILGVPPVPGDPPYREFWAASKWFVWLGIPEMGAAADRMDLARIWIDADRDPNTGLLLGAIGADFRAEAWLWRGAVAEASLCSWQPDAAAWDWLGFSGCVGIYAAAGAGGLEFGLRSWWLRWTTPSYGEAVSWSVEILSAEGVRVSARDVLSSAGPPPSAWRERAEGAWLDGVRADGNASDWKYSDALREETGSDPASPFDVRATERVGTERNASILVRADPRAYRGADVPWTPRPPPKDDPPRRDAAPPATGIAVRPAADGRAWLTVLWADGAAFARLWRGEVMEAWAVSDGTRRTAWAATTSADSVEVGLPGISILGLNLTIVASDAETGDAAWASGLGFDALEPGGGWDRDDVGPLAAPNPPDFLDISGNQVHWFRVGPHASETACSAANRIASTTQGSGPLTSVTLSAGQDACFYADATTGTTIPAGSWETLLDVATTSGDVDAYLYPTADGTYDSGWQSQNAGCAAGTHWQCVEEVWPPDDATSYVISTTTLSDKESNAVADYSVVAGFTDIDVTHEYRCAAASGAAGGDSFSFVVVGAEEYTSAEHNCVGTWATFTDFRETSPSGNEWTAADVNALECGYVSDDSDLNPDAWVSACRLRIQVSYPATEYDVRIEVWDKPTNAVKTAIGSCLDVTATGDDVQCLVSGVAQQVLDGDDVVRVRIAHSSTAGTVRIDFDDVDPTGNSRVTVPIPEFPEVALAWIGAASVAAAAIRRRRR